MNRHFKTFLLVLGGVTLVAGSAIFAVGCKSIGKNTITREVDLSTKEEFTKFDFACDTSDIEFVLTTDSTKKIVYQESEKVFHTDEVKDGTLFIKQVEDIKWYERIFTFDFAPKKATIYLPVAELDELKVDNSTGDLKIPHDFSFKSVDIKLSTGNISFNANVNGETKITTSTGDVSLSDNSLKSLFVHRSTGKLTMKNVNVEEAITVEGSTGDVKISNTNAASLKITSSTGEVNLNNVKLTGDLDIKTSTGDVEFDDLDFANGNIKTSTGDVEGTLSTAKYIEAETDTGKVKVDSDRTATQELKVKTDTGNIKISNK